MILPYIKRYLISCLETQAAIVTTELLRRTKPSRDSYKGARPLKALGFRTTELQMQVRDGCSSIHPQQQRTHAQNRERELVASKSDL
jgi:cbb3-type cytochrome oxidase cytochrome c subunit